MGHHIDDRFRYHDYHYVSITFHYEHTLDHSYCSVVEELMKPKPNIAPFGSWKSPITSELITSETTRFGQIAVDGENLYWTESRPKEGGRNVIIQRTADGHLSSLTPESFNVRTRVHEYGGGAYLVGK